MTELEKSILEDAKNIIHNDEIIAHLIDMNDNSKELAVPFCSNGVFDEAIFDVDLKRFTRIEYEVGVDGPSDEIIQNLSNGKVAMFSITETKSFNIPYNKE